MDHRQWLFPVDVCQDAPPAFFRAGTAATCRSDFAERPTETFGGLGRKAKLQRLTCISHQKKCQSGSCRLKSWFSNKLRHQRELLNSRHPVLSDSGNGPRESAWLSASPAWLQLQRIDAFSSQRGVPLAACLPVPPLSVCRSSGGGYGQTRGHRPQAARGTLLLKRRGGG